MSRHTGAVWGSLPKYTGVQVAQVTWVVAAVCPWQVERDLMSR
jgi:hypothetical protein